MPSTTSSLLLQSISPTVSPIEGNYNVECCDRNQCTNDHNNLSSTRSCLTNALQTGNTLKLGSTDVKISNTSTTTTTTAHHTESLRTTYFSFFACFSASLGSYSMGIALACLNTCFEHISRDIESCSSPTNCTHISSRKHLIHISIYVGLLLGSISAAPILRYGRRFSLLLFAGFHIIAALTCAISTSFATLLWGRLLAGISSGGLVVSLTIYISEISPTHLRGAFSTLNPIGITLGELIVVSLGNALHQLDNNGQPLYQFDRILWRFMVGCSSIPALILICIFTTFLRFETPHFYLRQRDITSFIQVLQIMNHPSTVHTSEQAILKAVQRAEEAELKGLSLMSIITNSQYCYILICGIVVAAFHQVTGINVYISSSNRLLSKTGLSSQYLTLMTTLLMVVHFVATLPGFWLVEKVGRRRLLLIGICAMTMSVTPAVIALWIDPTSVITIALVIAGANCFMMFFSSTYGPVVWCFIGEIFPIEVKNSGTSTCAAVHWLAAIVTVGISQFLSDRYAFTLFWTMGFVAFILIYFLVLETRNCHDTPYIIGSQNNNKTLYPIEELIIDEKHSTNHDLEKYNSDLYQVSDVL